VDLWHRRYLRLPTAAEWERAGVDHPSRRTVTRAFGSWNAALAAAGFQPRRPGQNLRWELRSPCLATRPGEFVVAVKIAVCVKHVPEGTPKLDPGSKRLDRSGRSS
jgi:hypothetical protein